MSSGGCSLRFEWSGHRIILRCADEIVAPLHLASVEVPSEVTKLRSGLGIQPNTTILEQIQDEGKETELISEAFLGG